MAVGIVLLCSAPAFAQRLIYHVDLTHTEKHLVSVEIQLTGVRPDTLVFQMPVWSPGIYSTVNYGRFIQDFQALDSAGNELTVLHKNKNIWKIPNAEAIARVTYTVEDSHSDESSPEIGLARIDRNGVFANTEALFGYFDNDESIPATILFTVPKGWTIATTLDPATDGEVGGDARYHQTSFNMDDYSDLANSPLVAAPKFQTAHFMRDGVEYSVVATGSEFPVDSFATAASQIVSAESSFFGKVPSERYLFVIDAGAGEPFGIEHEKSSVYTLPDADWNTHAPAIEHLVASTLFKTWNGGEFHISQLGPVDYTEPVLARSLWFSEGVSEYYAELLRVRYGLTTPAEFFSAVDSWLALERNDTASLESLSLRMKKFDPNCAECLRARGALAAMLLDIDIRDKTHRRHSLDNVLLRMNRDVASGKTYDDLKFEKTLSNYSNVDLTDFYDRYVRKADVLPLEAYLEKMGAGSEVPASMKTGDEAGINLALNAAGTAIIAAPPAEDSLQLEEVLADNKVREMDLRQGDTVTAIDGENVSTEAMEDAKARLKTGKPVKLTLVRNAKPVPVELKAKRAIAPKTLRLALLKKATPDELALRRAMLGKRTLRKVRNPKYFAQNRGVR